VGDLVFGELNFLARKDEAASKPTPPEGVPKKKRKKDRIKSKEGEISAYFTSAAQANAGKDDNIQTNFHQHEPDTNTRSSRRERELSSKADAPVRTVEIPEKRSYLGFRSRGRHYESSSYVTWSESVRAPSTRPRQPSTKDTTRQCHNLTKNPAHSITACEHDAVSKRPAPPSMNKQRTDATVERFAVSSVGPPHQRMSRSLSYPQHTSSPRRVNLVDRAAKFQSTESIASPSSMPSHLPTRSPEKLRPCRPAVSSKDTKSDVPSVPGTDSAAMYQQATADDNENDGNTREETSSDLGRVLQQCNNTFHLSRQAAVPRRRHTELPKPSFPGRETGRDRIRPRTHDEPPRRPTVRFSGVETIPPMLPNFSGYSIYEQQAQRQQVPLPALYEDDQVYEELYPDAQEDMGDDLDMMHNHEQLEEFVEDPGVDGERFEATGYSFAEHFASESVVGHVQSENRVVAPGFWRPNRLY
jgi:hypothetical protein